MFGIVESFYLPECTTNLLIGNYRKRLKEEREREQDDIVII